MARVTLVAAGASANGIDAETNFDSWQVSSSTRRISLKISCRITSAGSWLMAFAFSPAQVEVRR
jgi:hypothetical protein